MRPIIAALLLASSCLPAFSGDNSFSSLVRQVEQHYGHRRMFLPFVGALAGLAARPAGVTEFHFAIVPVSAAAAGRTPEFHPGAGWRPLVRVTEKHGEQTVVYARDEGAANVRMLLVTRDHSDAVVVEMRLDAHHLAKFVNEKSRTRRDQSPEPLNSMTQ